LKDWKRGLTVPTRGILDGAREMVCAKSEEFSRRELATTAAADAIRNKATTSPSGILAGTIALQMGPANGLRE
jgi:hypothetical protein